MEVPQQFSECSFAKDLKSDPLDQNGKPVVCISTPAIQIIAKVIGISDEKLTPCAIMAKAKKELGCQSEACVLSAPEVIKEMGFAKAHEEKITALKIGGPLGDKWLNNFTIDLVLDQFAAGSHGAFFAYPFAMIDFAEYQHQLVKHLPEALYREGYRCFGCVLNTDRSTGQGKHWICIFGDMRGADDWTIEFFNSTGNVHRPVVNYLAIARKSMQVAAETLYSRDRRTSSRHVGSHADGGHIPECRSVIVCEVEHQTGNSECGIYTLYYIWSRLLGEPYTSFMKKRISDTKVAQFRKFFFRNEE